MSLTAKILNRVVVLAVTFSDKESYTLQMVRCRFAKGGVVGEEVLPVEQLEDIKTELAANPVIVLVGGYGVISKQTDAAAEIVAKVTSADSGFRWTQAGSEISFVRGEQLAALEHAFDEAKAKVVAVRCVPLGKDAEIREMAAAYAQRWYSESANIRTVLRPSAAGSAMAQIVARRLRLPVLAVVLLGLMINATASSGVRAKYAAADVELQALRRTTGQADDVTRRQQELIREYDGALPRRISLLCDRAAMVLPEGITLTSLCVQPLLRNIEAGKKATFASDRIEITGHAAVSTDVSRYIAELTNLGLVARVQLASMERDRDSGLFNFKITLEL